METFGGLFETGVEKSTVLDRWVKTGEDAGTEDACWSWNFVPLSGFA